MCCEFFPPEPKAWVALKGLNGHVRKTMGNIIAALQTAKQDDQERLNLLIEELILTNQKLEHKLAINHSPAYRPFN
jgi:hypothetical protein